MQYDILYTYEEKGGYKVKEYKAIKVVPELHQMFKILSAQEGKNMAEMLEELIRLYKKSKEEN